MLQTRMREIRKQADVFRSKCRIGRYGIINLFVDCERMGYKLIRYPLGAEADLGFTLKRDDDRIIFTNSSVRLSREIFTLAHEIGHAVLHMNDMMSYIDNAYTISGYETADLEQEANYFAACLLLPQESLDRFLDLEIPQFAISGLAAVDVARIMSEFQVSFDMVLNRLENLGKIDSAEKSRLDTEKYKTSVGNLLKSVGGNARLNDPARELAIPYEYMDDVIYNYNHRVIPVETLKRVLNCYQLSTDDVQDRLLDDCDEDEVSLDDLIGGLTD